MALTMISLCRLTSTPSFMLCSTVVLGHTEESLGQRLHPASPPQRCLRAALPFPGLPAGTCSQVLLHHKTVRLPRKPQHSPSPHDPARLQTFLPSLPITTGHLSSPSRVTHGISSGKTSARMLMESVLALDVGAAARRIFRRAIWGEKREMEKGVGGDQPQATLPTRQRNSDTDAQREENLGT